VRDRKGSGVPAAGTTDWEERGTAAVAAAKGGAGRVDRVWGRGGFYINCSSNLGRQIARSTPPNG
jgi:hypothetical protein